MSALRVLPLLAVLVVTAPASAAAPQSPCRPQPRSAGPLPLTNAQCIAASKIVSTDATVRKLLAHVKSSAAGRPDPWGAGDGVHNIGAVVKIHLATPLNVTRVVLPTANFAQGDDSGKYTQGHFAVSLHATTSLWVFVDLSKRRVVWIIPYPPDSEGPPPTSIRPYTAPAGFVLGTGGASEGDAARGLTLHSVTFDPTGRLAQEEWFDPITGKAVTNIYDPERKLVVSFASVYSGGKLTVTTIAYEQRTWTSGSDTVPAGAEGVLALDSRTVAQAIRSRVSVQKLTPDGQETLNGIDTLRLRGTNGLVYFGFSFDAAPGTMWVDSITYLPVQQTIENGRTHAADETTLFSWLPRTAATAGVTTLSVPKGYKHTASTGLPHIFGD